MENLSECRLTSNNARCMRKNKLDEMHGMLYFELNTLRILLFDVLPLLAASHMCVRYI
jgi:hypothetical protein